MSEGKSDSLKGYIEFSLNEMIEQLGEDKVKELLSDFSCPKNKDVEYFLLNRAIEFSKQSITITQLVFLQYKGRLRLVGYYSITQKAISVKDRALSNTMSRRVSKFGTRDTVNKGYVISAPLIAQLGKNFTDDLNLQITGDELLKMAILKVKQAQAIIGGKAVYIECEESERLIDFYTSNGFVQFDKRAKDSEEDSRIQGEYLVQLLKIIKWFCKINVVYSLPFSFLQGEMAGFFLFLLFI